MQRIRTHAAKLDAIEQLQLEQQLCSVLAVKLREPLDALRYRWQ